MITNKPPFAPFMPPMRPMGPAAGPTASASVTTSASPGSLDVHVALDFKFDLGAPPHNCWLPPPAPQQSGAPAGQGLTPASEFGPNAIRTAGGYTIVPEGKDAAWAIFAPGQKPGETPNTRVWGDPHVTEKDGTRWDFSKSSDFRLGDGTVISVKTSKEQGQSLSSELDITNGMDRVKMTGIDKGKPSLGQVTHDGYQARAELADKDTFVLGGDKDHVQWFKEEKGEIKGEVTGASLTSKDGTPMYEQKVDGNKQYAIDPSLQPKVGTPAWGNLLRDQAVDLSRRLFGAGSMGAELTGAALAQNHTQTTEAQAQADARKQQMSDFMQKLGSMMQLFKLLDLVNLGRRQPVQAW
jgi:hypothetical protein